MTGMQLWEAAFVCLNILYKAIRQCKAASTGPSNRSMSLFCHALLWVVISEWFCQNAWTDLGYIFSSMRSFVQSNLASDECNSTFLPCQPLGQIQAQMSPWSCPWSKSCNHDGLLWKWQVQTRRCSPWVPSSKMLTPWTPAWCVHMCVSVWGCV
jgi:hypothetical protein